MYTPVVGDDGPSEANQPEKSAPSAHAAKASEDIGAMLLSKYEGYARQAETPLSELIPKVQTDVRALLKPGAEVGFECLEDPDYSQLVTSTAYAVISLAALLKEEQEVVLERLADLADYFAKELEPVASTKISRLEITKLIAAETLHHAYNLATEDGETRLSDAIKLIISDARNIISALSRAEENPIEIVHTVSENSNSPAFIIASQILTFHELDHVENATALRQVELGAWTGHIMHSLFGG